jgi:methionyl-tRNA formyltransferase
VAQLREWRPDLLVVAAYGQLLKKEVIEAAPLGAVNIHASLLPKYRGAAPIAWALYHGETRTGVTIFQITTGMDSGDILAQEPTDIGPDETAGEVEARLAPLGANLVRRVLGQMRDGALVRTKQDHAQATRAPKLKKEDGLIDWTRTAEQVCNQVRAMQPWPTPYTFLHRASGSNAPLRVIVHQAVPGPSVTLTQEMKPGHLLPPVAGLLRVLVGKNQVVHILKIQPAGKRVLYAQEFLAGRPVQPGDYFGPETLA